MITVTLTRTERLRRVVILCCSFARNLAFYRAGWSDCGQSFLSETHPQASFWRQTNGNFFDACVLDWCKLFGDKRAEHYWGLIVSDLDDFEMRLYQHLNMDAFAFRSRIDAMRAYRDKFVAHLDSLRVADLPMLDAAQAAVWFYHAHTVEREAKPGDLVGLPDTANKLARGYDQCVDEASAVFQTSVKLSGGVNPARATH